MPGLHHQHSESCFLPLQVISGEGSCWWLGVGLVLWLPGVWWGGSMLTHRACLASHAAGLQSRLPPAPFGAVAFHESTFQLHLLWLLRHTLTPALQAQRAIATAEGTATAAAVHSQAVIMTVLEYIYRCLQQHLTTSPGASSHATHASMPG